MKSHGNNSIAEQLSQNVLKQVTLSGLILPLKAAKADSSEPEYKFVCDSGDEYLIEANSAWLKLLSFYMWQEVKIAGLLNLKTMTLTPQKIFPKGPAGEKDNVIDMVTRLNRFRHRPLTSTQQSFAINNEICGFTLTAVRNYERHF